jgi:hypothetical protein
LALRELRAASAEAVTGPDRDLFLFLRDRLAPMMARGVAPGIESNPWLCRFESDSGAFEPGRVAENEARRVPASDLEAMKRLVRLLPTHGVYWALLGELLNASGDPLGALECFQRAENLQYTERLLREHRRILKEYQRDLERRTSEQLDQAVAAPVSSPTASPAAAPGGWSNLTSQPGVLAVLLIGGLCIALLLLLQIREWSRAMRRKP